MTAVTVTASATEDQSVFWRPSAALQVAHKPTKKRSLAASLLAAISALTLLLGLAGPASASTAPDSETAVAAQTDPTQAFVAAGGLETPATVRPNGSFGYDGVLGCCVAPTSALDDVLPYPTVTDPKLQNYVDNLYKGTTNLNRVGTGTTADAVRNELTTGLPTGGTFHLTKAQETINGLTRWLRNNPDASYSDRLVAQSLLDDLVDAVGTTP